MIEAILQTEEECRKKEADAREHAEEKKRNARTDSARIISDARREVDKMLRDDAAAIEKSSQLELERDRKKTDAQCSELCSKADKNLDRVTKLVVEAITS